MELCRKCGTSEANAGGLEDPAGVDPGRRPSGLGRSGTPHLRGYVARYTIVAVAWGH
jgi:hypothetical protein